MYILSETDLTLIVFYPYVIATQYKCHLWEFLTYRIATNGRAIAFLINLKDLPLKKLKSQNISLLSYPDNSYFFLKRILEAICEGFWSSNVMPECLVAAYKSRVAKINAKTSLFDKDLK